MAAFLNNASTPSFFLILSLTTLLLSFSPSHSSDPDPLQDFCVADLNSAILVNGFPCKPPSKVNSKDFISYVLAKEGNTSNVFRSAITNANVQAFPGLNTLGISMNRVDFAPGGIFPPHSHPRSTEAGVVIIGEVLVGFVSSSNALYSNVVKAGEMFVIPRGLVHFILNKGHGKALTISAFNSQGQVSSVVPNILFGSKPTIPNEVLTKTFQVSESVIKAIKSKFAS
ncbi:hypothetical protein Sjap_015913 [Stephania japonica]|uniref:Germin-like protein n=1 Tax=Stephania japonica TaxID=461633 RepID=A0AAP0NUF7_9MAGN